MSIIEQNIAQKLTIEDYNRAVSFSRENYYNKTAFNLYTNVNWFQDNSGGWFIDNSKLGKIYKKIQFKDDQIINLFDHEKLAVALSTIKGENVDAFNINIQNIDQISENEIEISFNSVKYLVNLTNYQLNARSKEEVYRNESESISPDGQWIAYTQDYNLFIKSAIKGESHQLSFDGAKNYEYASYYGWFDIMEGENGERPKHFNVSWSKDSKFLKTNLIDLRNASKMYMLDYSIDSLYRPKLLSYYRGSPGDTNMVYVTPKFYSIDNKMEIKTNLPRNTHINSVGTIWSKDSGIVYANFAERGFKRHKVLKIDLNSGLSTTLIDEESLTNIDGFSYEILENQNKLVFFSDRSGWRQLYQINLETLELRPLTEGSYVINNIEYIDEKTGELYITASGIDETMNPYFQQLFRINQSGDGQLLTPEKAHHRISFSKDGKYFVDNYSTVQQATNTVLRVSESGDIINKLTSADVTKQLAEGWNPPFVFDLIAKDGKTKIYGAIWQPINFDPSKKYPIIDNSYTGPHTQVSPKSFDQAFNNQSLAELGFLVIQIDGLGTAGRSKSFLNHSYKNMGNNLEDHVLAIQELAKKYAWIDAEKVGIMGHSAGGYDAGHGMLAFPDFYKVGVASSGDHDFRMEKAWWPEMYMGWPVDSTYDEVSNINLAKNLKGKLLLVHGGIDDNVNVSATFKLSEALIKAGKEFDLLIIPSQRHGYQGDYGKYFIKKRWNYFVKNLKDDEGIWEFEY